MTRQGIRKLQCQECGTIREVETGIKTMHCCAKPMVEVEDEDEGMEEQSPTMLKLKQSD